MAVIICEIHGRSGCYAVCSHIAEDKRKTQKPEKLITMSFYFGNFAGNPECPMTYYFTYCPKCVEQFNFPEESFQFSEENSSDEELDKKFEFVGDKFGMICCNCFEEFMNEHNISLS
jgi:hypothetical protein